MGGVLILKALWPVTPVSVDPARRVDHELKQDECGAGREYELVREYTAHHPRHSDRNALVSRVVALSTGLLVLQACHKARLVLRLQRRLLWQAVPLARIVARRTAIRHAEPLAGPIGVFSIVENLSADGGDQHHRCQRDCTDRDAIMHRLLHTGRSKNRIHEYTSRIIPP